MNRRPPRSTRTYTLFPSTTLVRSRHLHDRPRPLVQRLHQPVRRGEAFGKKGALRLVQLPAGQIGIVAAVDEHARQRGGVQLHRPAAACARDEYIRNQVGSAASTARVSQYVETSVVADSLNKKK